jgi:TLC domain
LDLRYIQSFNPPQLGLLRRSWSCSFVDLLSAKAQARAQLSFDPAHAAHPLFFTKMLDPIPPPLSWLSEAVRPVSDLLEFRTLPYHVHEIIFALFFFQSVQSFVSPVLSSYLFPDIYPKLNRRTKVNWDVHVVSTVQSCLINALALWVLFTDEERKNMNALERVYGYTGGCGLIQGLAIGYFLWDVLICTRHFKIFGLGFWAHGVCALSVFSLGFVSCTFALDSLDATLLWMLLCCGS